MSSRFDPHRPLPRRADRQKIIEQAQLVLTEARAIAEQCDQTFALLSAEWSAECTKAAAGKPQMGGKHPTVNPTLARTVSQLKIIVP